MVAADEYGGNAGRQRLRQQLPPPLPMGLSMVSALPFGANLRRRQ